MERGESQCNIERPCIHPPPTKKKPPLLLLMYESGRGRRRGNPSRAFLRFCCWLMVRAQLFTLAHASKPKSKKRQVEKETEKKKKDAGCKREDARWETHGVCARIAYGRTKKTTEGCVSGIWIESTCTANENFLWVFLRDKKTTAAFGFL